MLVKWTVRHPCQNGKKDKYLKVHTFPSCVLDFKEEKKMMGMIMQVWGAGQVDG